MYKQIFMDPSIFTFRCKPIQTIYNKILLQQNSPEIIGPLNQMCSLKTH